MNFTRLPLQSLRNRDLALLRSSEQRIALSADELALLERKRAKGFGSESFLIASFLTLCVVAIIGIEAVHHRERRASFSVEGMCCEFAVNSAADKLAKVPGVIDVEPRYSQKSLEVSIDCGAYVSPRRLWDAFNGSPIRPVALAYHGNTYRDRPSN